MEDKGTGHKWIIAWAVATMSSSTLFALGVASQAHEAMDWKLDTWVWLSIGGLLFAGTQLLTVYGYWKENRRLRAEIRELRQGPILRWRELSKQAGRLVSTIDLEVKQSIGTADLPLESLEKCMSMLMGQIGGSIDVTDGEKVKAWVLSSIQSGVSQVQQKNNLFLMVVGTFPKAMNEYKIGIGSIASASYVTAHNDLRKIVEERMGSTTSKAYKTYLDTHNLYWSLVLLFQYRALFNQYVETLPDESKGKAQVQEIAVALEGMSVISAALLDNSEGLLLIAKSTLVESITGVVKETNGHSGMQILPV